MSSPRFNVVKGKRLRATRTDECGMPQAGPASQLVTKGFVTAQWARVQNDAEDLELKNAEGEVCVSDRTKAALKWFTLTLTLCDVDPELINFFTDDPLILDHANNPIGVSLGEQSVEGKGVAVEIWAGTGRGDCAVPTDDSVFANPSALTRYGYWVAPAIVEGQLGDIEIGASAASFTVSGITNRAPRWGRGPYEVMAGDALNTPSRLLSPFTEKRHVDLFSTTIAPPPVTEGATELILPQPYYPNVAQDEIQKVEVLGATGGTFTLSFEGTATTPIAYNATAAAVEAALEALASIGAGNVSVIAGRDGWIVQFTGTLAGTSQELLVANGTSLTGSGAAATVRRVFAGG